MTKHRQLLTSTNQDWRTPLDIYEGLNKEFNFDFDPCPNHSLFDGIKQEWGQRNYVNPPYTTKIQNAFVEKAYKESLNGKLSVLLIPVRTSSIRWQTWILNKENVEIRFVSKRIKFLGADGQPSKSVATFCSAVIIFRPIDAKNAKDGMEEKNGN